MHHEIKCSTEVAQALVSTLSSQYYMYYINVKGGGHNCSGFKNVLGVLTTEEKLHRMNRVFRANIELPKLKKKCNS